MRRISVNSVFRTWLTCMLIIAGINNMAMAQTSRVNWEHTYGNTELSAAEIDNIFDLPGVVTTNQNQEVKLRNIDLYFDMGDVQNIIPGNWEAHLELKLTFTDVVNGNGNPFNTKHIDLRLYKDGSEVVSRLATRISISADDYSEVFNHLQVEVEQIAYTINGSVNNWVEDNVRLIFKSEDMVGMDVVDGSDIPIIISNRSYIGVGPDPATGKCTGVNFLWNLPTPASQHFDSYDLEVLKIEPEYDDIDNLNKVLIDWSKAARIEVEKGMTSYTMTLAEGTGVYAWRVRCIGSMYEGGRSNRLNYGEWSVADGDGLYNGTGPAAFYSDGFGTFSSSINAITVNNTLKTGQYFYFEQFDDNINWIYNKVLTEGSRQAEKITYADGLGMVHQVQGKSFSSQEVVANETVYDYSARPALNSLPAPVGSNWLGYQPLLFTNNSSAAFSAADFDSDVRLYDILSPGTNNIVNNYYSDNNHGSMKDDYVPSAGGVPYTRALYDFNGRGTVYKQSGSGLPSQLADGNDPATVHNSITTYSIASQTELDRIFGSEAPLCNTVTVVQSQDKNGVATVQYIGQDGKVLATMLDNIGSLNNMEDPEGLDGTPFLVSRTMDNGVTAVGEYVNHSVSSVVINHYDAITVDNLKIDYVINPSQFSSTCGDICWSCDYIIEIKIRCPMYPDDLARNITETEHIIPADLFGTADCGANLNAVTKHYVYTLDPGVYMVEKNVYTYNSDNAGSPYLENRINDLMSAASQWTAANNCCGPYTYDQGGLVCDNNLPACGSELEEWAGNYYDQYFSNIDNTVKAELTYVLPSGEFVGDNYSANITPPPPLAGTGFYIQRLANSAAYTGNDGREKFKNLLNAMCNSGLTPEQIVSCFTFMGDMMRTNMIQMEQNGTTPGGANNPPISFNDDFDLLQKACQCLDFDIFEISCSHFENIVWFDEQDLNTLLSLTVNTIVLYTSDDDISSVPATNFRTILMPNVAEMQATPDNAALQLNNCYQMALSFNGAPITPHFSTDDAADDASHTQFSNNFLLSTLSTDQRSAIAQMFCNCASSITVPDPNADAQQGVVDVCTDGCNDDLRFQSAVDQYVTEYNHEQGILTPEPYAWYPGVWQSADELFSGGQKECFIQGMVAQCIVQCQMIQSSLTLQILEDKCVCDPADLDYSIDCYTSPVEFGSNTFACAEEFIVSDEYIDYINSDDYKDIVQAEQQAFIEAYSYSPVFAPPAGSIPPNNNIYSNDGASYSNIPDTNYVKDEIIEFFHSSIDHNSTYRNEGQDLTTGTFNYPTTFFSLSDPNLDCSQAEYDFFYYNVLVSPGVYENKQGTAVTNVIWDKGTSIISDPDDNVIYEDPADDIIKEINVAIYCTGSTTPHISWSYAPEEGTSNPCDIFIPGISGINTRVQLVDFFFNNSGILNAILKETACDANNPDAIISNNVCTERADAYAEIEIAQAGTTGDFLLVDIAGEYITENAIVWEASETSESFAIKLANAINTKYTEPNFKAYISTSDATHIIIAMTGMESNQTPADFTFNFENNGSSLLVDESTSGFEVFTNHYLLGTPPVPLSPSLISCDDIEEEFTNECPAGFLQVEHVWPDNNIPGNYTITDFNDFSTFVDDLKDWWRAQLKILIESRQSQASGSIVMNTFMDSRISAFGFSNYGKKYISEKTLFINGSPYTASVGLIGRSTDTNKSLSELFLMIECEEAFPSMNIYFLSWMYNYNDDPSLVMPGLTIDLNDPSSFTPQSDYLEYFFSNVDAIGPGGSIDFDGNYYVYFKASNLFESYFPDFVPFGNAGAVSDITYSTPRPEFTSLMEGNETCGDLCTVCMRWQRPKFPFPDSGPVTTYTCEDEAADFVESQEGAYLSECLQTQIAGLNQSYYQNCLGNINDELTISYYLNTGYYTLYYYDRAGNLIRTVPPKGVTALTNLAGIDGSRGGESVGDILPNQISDVNLYNATVSEYQYNSLGQIVSDYSPDKNRSQYWYNANGQLILSRNAKQNEPAAVADKEYSYSRYDRLGRIIETGVLKGFNRDLLNETKVPELWSDTDFPANTAGLTFSDQVYTTYTVDQGINYMDNATMPQENLRNRISMVVNSNGGTSTYYSYDPHGNVKWLAHNIPGLGLKYIRYEYDLVSGKVKEVFYNENTAEQFIHKYEYDEDNRITKVLTSRDGLVWDRDAAYSYYKHGALARTEIGQDNLQGIDYVYTVEGYLKAINQPELVANGSRDPGADGAYCGSFIVTDAATQAGNSVTAITVNSTNILSQSVNWNNNAIRTATDIVKSINAGSATHGFKADNSEGTSNKIYIKSSASPGSGVITYTSTLDFTEVENVEILKSYLPDEFGMELGYYHDDYTRTGSSLGSNSAYYPYASIITADTRFDPDYASLYNGNIAWWASNIREGQSTNGLTNMGLKTGFYRYDKLNRLVKSDMSEFSSSYTGNERTAFNTTYLYDLNGNLKELTRGIAGNYTDNLYYSYNIAPGTATYESNRLNWVDDASDNFTAGLGEQLSGNYNYDAIGNLKSDVESGIDNIEWTPSGKVAKITRTSSSTLDDLEFIYDAMGNRIVKISKPHGTINPEQPDEWLYTYYVRDAQGNIMSVYSKKKNQITDEIETTQDEIPIYGSSRLGEYRPNLKIENSSGPVSNVSTLSELSSWYTGLDKFNFQTIDFTTWNASFNGISGNLKTTKNFSIGEDRFGNVKLHFVSYLTTNPVSTVNLVNDADNNFSISNYSGCNNCSTNDASTNNLLGATNTKSIIANSAADENIYFIITGQNGQMYYHEVDLSDGINAVTKINKKLKITGNVDLTYNAQYNEYALAVYQDYNNQLQNKLYVAVNNKSSIDIYEFAITTTIEEGKLVHSYHGITTIPSDQIFTSHSMLTTQTGSSAISPVSTRLGSSNIPLATANPLYDLGEMHISPDGSELSISMFRNNKHSIEHYAIDPSAALTLSSTGYTTVATEATPVAAVIRNSLKKLVYSFDYLPGEAKNMYIARKKTSVISEPRMAELSAVNDMESYLASKEAYNSFEAPVATKALSLPGGGSQSPIGGLLIDVAELDRSTQTVQSVKTYPNAECEVRRGKDDKMYLSRAGNTSLNVFSGNFSLAPTIASMNASTGAKFTSGLPLQPFKKDMYPLLGERKTGNKYYEFTDHLGNVRVVLKDIRMWDDALGNSNGTMDANELYASVATWSDYYPFGMQMPGRSFNSNEYRFGFNGQEKDDEITGVTGSHLAFEYRIYDSRIGRFLSVDPIAKDYPWNSPYAFAENRPIDGIDLEGLEHFSVTKNIKENCLSFRLIDAEEVAQVTWESYSQFKTNPMTLPWVKEWMQNVYVNDINKTISLPNSRNVNGGNIITKSYDKNDITDKESEISGSIYVPEFSRASGIIMDGEITKESLTKNYYSDTYLGKPVSFEVYVNDESKRGIVLDEMKNLFGDDVTDKNVNWLSEPAVGDKGTTFEVSYIYKNKDVKDIE